MPNITGEPAFTGVRGIEVSGALEAVSDDRGQRALMVRVSRSTNLEG
jgi:hypothetical protein